ncbi:recombinase [bacterium]|nr:recombinase [bacterium]
MKTSETIGLIAKALLSAQKEITFAVKDSTNPHFKNRYADLASVIDAVKPALNNAGIVFVQSASPSDDGRLSLTTRLIHESGEWIEDMATCPLPKQEPQGYISCLTYMRRSNLASILGLKTEDDDGEATRMKPDDYIKRITSSKTIEDLHRNYINVMAEVKSDKALSQAIVSAKDETKKLLEGDK